MSDDKISLSLVIITALFLGALCYGMISQNERCNKKKNDLIIECSLREQSYKCESMFAHYCSGGGTVLPMPIVVPMGR